MRAPAIRQALHEILIETAQLPSLVPQERIYNWLNAGLYQIV